MDKTTSGLINGLLGVLIFSGSLPATRAAVEQFDPVFLTVARAAIAGFLGLALLLMFKEQRPARSDIVPLLVVAIGVVVGFPLLTALALRHVTAAHSIVFIGLLPLATVIFGVLRGGERPRPAFWVFAVLGSLLVASFAFGQGLSASPIGDSLMLAAIIVCGLGYAEGAKLSRTLGGWQVISWALVLLLPVMLPLTLLTKPESFAGVGKPASIGLAYVSLFSMLIGFVFWYRGLAQGGIAAVGQLQLLQPFFGLALAAMLLGETVSATMLAVTVGVILCVAGDLCAKQDPSVAVGGVALLLAAALSSGQDSAPAPPMWPGQRASPGEAACPSRSSKSIPTSSARCPASTSRSRSRGTKQQHCRRASTPTACSCSMTSG